MCAVAPELEQRLPAFGMFGEFHRIVGRPDRLTVDLLITSPGARPASAAADDGSTLRHHRSVHSGGHFESWRAAVSRSADLHTVEHASVIS